MRWTTVIGACAPLVLLAQPVRADWRTPITGAPPVLSSSFVPRIFRLGRALPRRAPLVVLAMPGARPILPARFTLTSWAVAPLRATLAAPPLDALTLVPGPAIGADPDLMPALAPVSAGAPLFERRLSLTQRGADIAPELQDAIARIEPMYDPTRLDGPDAEILMHVSAGTAAMANVFADRWRRASPDANINRATPYVAMAWQATPPLPCDAFAKARAHMSGATALSDLDCQRLQRYQRIAADEVGPVAIVAAAVSVPIFAAPLPGSRMSSSDFWAAQRARIHAIEAGLHRKWADGTAPLRADFVLRR